MTPRVVSLRYEDPLDRVWIACAAKVGLRIVRDPSSFASTDGRGTLRLSTSDGFDADDSIAQMVFHELCHSLVEGPGSFELVDWGLDNVGTDDEVREHACLRVQAALSRPLGLSGVLAPTTDFRAYWDALGADPLEPAGDPSIPLARRALARVDAAPWGPHLRVALEATSAIAGAVAASTVGAASGTSLWARVEPARPRHPSGAPLAAEGTRAFAERCGTCAWAAPQGRGARCLSLEARVERSSPACERWEPPADCATCGACCREAFDTLVVDAAERIVRRHPALVVLTSSGREMPRPRGRCAALEGQGTDDAPFACRVYEDRPRTCRDFRRGGAHCLTARRRVGRSR